MQITNNFSGLVLPLSPFRTNETSVDITASSLIYREAFPISGEEEDFCIDPKNRRPLHLERVTAEDPDEFLEFAIIPPGGNLIVETTEMIKTGSLHCAMYQAVGSLNLANIAVLGSIWVKPNWEGKLKVNLHNFNRVHSYKLYVDQVIGQMIYFQHRQQ